MNKLGGYILAGALGIVVSDRVVRCLESKTIDNLKEKVKSCNITAKEYDSLEKAIPKGFISTEAIGWQKALDSLKTDAACKKAYMEGAQMVRDSIKVASKIK